jgi:hypothetical protein
LHGKGYYWIHVWQQAGLGKGACWKFSFSLHSQHPTFETESRCPTSMTAKS